MIYTNNIEEYKRLISENKELIKHIYRELLPNEESESKREALVCALQDLPSEIAFAEEAISEGTQ